jgi:hypothetical protein
MDLCWSVGVSLTDGITTEEKSDLCLEKEVWVEDVELRL